MMQCVDAGKDVDLSVAVKASIITLGFKYSLSTGNWKQANVVGTQVGVSQV